ncbi:MAG: hypothetical protein HDR20_05620 [Lachnospiraceae bacterium]|nr:hypothetical protein [Lachnospiraceae bacterium]
MKKYVSILVVLIIIAVGTLFVSSGFNKRTDVYLTDFSVSEDGSTITIKTSLAGSIGYIRKIKTEKVDDAIYCSFYSTFGGLNSNIGVKNSFEIELNNSTVKIYFDRGTESDILVLERDKATNVWVQR